MVQILLLQVGVCSMPNCPCSDGQRCNTHVHGALIGQCILSLLNSLRTLFLPQIIGTARFA